MIQMLRAVGLSLLLSLTTFAARAQSLPVIPFKYLSQASTNSTLVSGAGQNVLKWIVAVNTTNTVYYLKFYNKATAPTCGTDTPILSIPIPAANTGGGLAAISFDDTRFSLGIGFCLTGALADNDSTNAATGVAINLGYLWL